MKRSGVRTIVLLATAVSLGGAAEKSFSHRQHLELKLECTSCHRQAATSIKASDNLMPRPEQCHQCHEKVSIKGPPEVMVSKFNHKLHVAMGNLGPVIAAAVRSGNYLGTPPGNLNATNACTACHRGLESSEAVTRAAYPQMADCLVCHNQIEPPFSCEKCHEPDADLKPPSHTAEYLESHSRPGALKEKQSCAVCHGRRFTCLGCH